MAKEKKESSYKDEDYDVILENESCASEIIRVIATIILTAVAVAGVGYVSHIYIVERNENGIRSEINRLESRIIAEIRTNKGVVDVSELQELEAKLRESEKARVELESKLILMSSNGDQATSTKEESDEKGDESSEDQNEE